MIEASLRMFVIADPAVSALVGPRVYTLKLPQTPQYPAVVYQRISGPRMHSHDGATGLAEGRWQFTAWARRYQDAKAVADALRQRMDGYSGAVGADEVGLIRLVNEFDEIEPAENDGGDYGVRQDYIVSYYE